MDTSPHATEIVRGLFGSTIGPVISSPSCSHNLHSGRMYIAHNALCFYSNMFGFEHKLLICMADIISATKMRTKSIQIRYNNSEKSTVVGTINDNAKEEKKQENNDNKLSSSEEQLTQPCEHEEHIFKSFEDRDSVLKILNHLCAQKSSNDSTVHQKSRIRHENGKSDKKRCKSLPPPLSKCRGMKESFVKRDECHDNKEVYINNTDDPSYDKEADISNSGDQSTEHRGRMRLFTAPDWTYRNPFSMDKETTIQDESFEDSLHKTTSDTKYSVLQSKSSSSEISLFTKYITTEPKVSSSSLSLSDWEKARESVKVYTESVINYQKIPSYSLDTFHDTFLADDAPHSIALFHEKIVGDRNVKVTPWQPTTIAESVSAAPPKTERTISFLHPRNSTLGPSNVDTIRTQTLQRFNSFGLIMFSNSIVKDIPYGDCFVVEEMWIVEPMKQNEEDVGEGQDNDTNIFLSIHFYVRFIKSTIFKKVIKTQSKMEVTQSLENYIKMVMSTIEPNDEHDHYTEISSYAEGEPSVEEQRVDLGKVQGTFDTLSLWSDFFSELQKTLSPIMCLMVTIFWMACQIYSLNNSVKSLDVELRALRMENSLIIQNLIK